jgi:hypothetical protein
MLRVQGDDLTKFVKRVQFDLWNTEFLAKVEIGLLLIISDSLPNVP